MKGVPKIWGRWCLWRCGADRP